MKESEQTWIEEYASCSHKFISYFLPSNGSQNHLDIVVFRGTPVIIFFARNMLTVNRKRFIIAQYFSVRFFKKNTEKYSRPVKVGEIIFQ